MSEQEKQSGREAQMSNIKAAMKVAETVRSTLGPAGMDKLLTNGSHHTVTNDGVTVLRELDIAHPGAQMMVEASIKVERFASLGTYIWQEVSKELDKRGKVRCDVGSYNDVGNSLITRLYDSEA